uniref:transcription elongation regulator 1-like protein isoform X2 n=1 Tax=Monopterus albus TaxID=43700 RepID=UPI0009B3C556|nr:transcription elongation regulator 1-like protein isoform X2 [Monopterus albus]
MVGGDVIMMLPVLRFKGQPVGMVTTTSPCMFLSGDPSPHWLWLASWSAAMCPAMPPLVFYPPAVWRPEHTYLWECPPVEVVPLIPPFYQFAPLHHPHPLPKLAEGWISPEEVSMFQRGDTHVLLTSQVAQRRCGHAPSTRLLLSPSQLSGHVRRDTRKSRGSETEDDNSSHLLHLLSMPPLRLPLLTAPPPTGGAHWEGVGLHTLGDKEVWPLVLTSQLCRGAWLQPIISLERRLSLPMQVMKEVHHSSSSRFSSRFTLMTDFRHKKQGMGGGKVSYRGALLLRTERTTDDNRQCTTVSADRGDDEDGKREEDSEEGRKNKRPVASTPVPGSPWCVVWTGDDRVFFFNPTIHLSVWERPGELIGRDISSIIEDPPHKRKKMTRDDISSSCHLPGLHGNDEDDELKHSSKRNRAEETTSLVSHPGELLSLELRMAHFREMMLERGVSAFSTWEKELHKIVFDPRYLLLTSDQRKQVFDQFVKSRVKDEYKEKKSKLQKAREEFRQLLEEVKITSRLTFKEFCTRYCGDQRFNALKRKTEQEVLFNHYITALKKREKENQARLKKMR